MFAGGPLLQCSFTGCSHLLSLGIAQMLDEVEEGLSQSPYVDGITPLTDNFDFELGHCTSFRLRVDNRQGRSGRAASSVESV
jgi:hypothetical protein